MAIPLTCPGCDTGFAVPDTLAGKWIKCKTCGTSVEVVAAKAVARPARAAVIADDDDYDDTPRPTRRGAKPAAGGSKLPLILAALGGFVVVGGGAAAYLAFSGDPKPPEVVVAPPVAPPAPAPEKPPAERPPAKVEVSAAEPPKGGGGGLVAPLSPGAVKPPAPVPTPGGAATTAPNKTEIDQLTLDRCKNAAVYIECDDGRGHEGSGSGWFGLEENMVFTNAHVIHMLAPNSPKPKKLTIFVNPGTPQQREIPHSRIEILAVDHKMDLALLRILNEKGLPPPLKTRLSGSLRDLERLIVLGYPGGMTLSYQSKSSKKPEITVNDTKVARVRRDDDGNLSTVQVSGGIYPGNSGGALVDADGRVAAVAVAVMLGIRGEVSQIAYSVPTEYCHGILAGRAAEVEYGVPYKAGKTVHFPVTVRCLDPLNRLKSVGIACWVGERSNKLRASGEKKPEADSGDTDYVEVPLKYTHTKDKQTAVGELVLPEAAAGRVYWSQPYYGNQSLDRFWLSGTPIKMASDPVDRSAVELAAKFKPGTVRSLTLSNKSAVSEFEEGEGADRSERVQIKTEVKGREVQLAPPAGTDYGALYRMRFESVGMSAERGTLKQDNILPKDMRKLFAQTIRQCEGAAWVNKSGEVVRTAADVRQVQPPQLGMAYKQLVIDPVMDSLLAATVRLPNKRVEPGETWKQTKTVRMAIQFDANADLNKKGDDKDDNETRASQQRPGQPKKDFKFREYKYQEEITYKYVGLRTRQGVKEAVLEVTGVIANVPGAPAGSGASGRVKGHAFLDLDTGAVIKAEVDREFEVDVSSDGVKRRLSGVNTYVIDRGSATAGTN